MSELEVAIRLMVVWVLGMYLYAKHRQRVRRQEFREPADWTGKGLDVTELRPKVEEVRRRQLAARQAPRQLNFHQALCAWARHAVRHLPYFQDRKTEANAK